MLQRVTHCLRHTTMILVVMPAGCLVSSGTGRSRSKASNSSVLKSGIPTSKPAEGFSKSPG